MSGPEAIAAIQLVDACIGIAKTIIDIGRAVHDDLGVPPKLRELLEKLPAIEELLETAQKNFKDGKISDDKRKSSEPILKQCKQALGDLRDIFRKACPTDKDNRSKRIWKGAKTVFLGRDSQVQKLLQVVQNNLKLLEQKEIYVIGDKLDELEELTKALGHDDVGKYSHTGEGHIVVTEGGSTYVGGSGHSRQINNPQNYHEAPTHIYQVSLPERPKTPSEPSSNGPFPPDPDFMDRATLSEEIRSKLAVRGARVALFGLGGVGKSQLVMEYTRQIRRQSPQTWVLWIHASNALRFDESVCDAAEFLKISGRQDANADIQRLLKYRLQDKSHGEWLVVLDNADDASFLVGLPASRNEIGPARRRMDAIPVCDHGTVIITTRNKSEARKLVHERNMIEILPMSAEEGEALIAAKLESSGPNNRILALALDCMPLAITQAAAYIREHTPRTSVQQYLEDIERSRIWRTNLLRRDIKLPDRDFEASSSVLLTWQISFKYIYKERRSAADLLSLMSFCDRVAIPELLLRADENHELESADSPSKFQEDVAMLRNFSFISTTADPCMWEMHRLVQDAMQLWLADRCKIGESLHRFVHCLDLSFPSDDLENWPTCRALFPHVRSAVGMQPTEQSARFEWASVLSNAASYAYTQGQWNDVVVMIKSSLSIIMADIGGESAPMLANKWMLVKTLVRQGRWKERENPKKQVVEICKQVFGEDGMLTLVSMAELAWTYGHQKRWSEAEKLEEQVVEICKQVFGEDDRMTLVSMGELALTYRFQQRWSEAEALEVQIWETRKRLLGEEHRDTLASMTALAATYEGQGRWKDAEELRVRAIKTSKWVLGEKHPDTLTSMSNLTTAYNDQERWNEAEELGVQLLETMRQVLGEEHPNTLTSMSNLAITYTGQERWSEAERLHHQAVNGLKRCVGPQDIRSLLAANHSERMLLIKTLKEVHMAKGGS